MKVPNMSSLNYISSFKNSFNVLGGFCALLTQFKDIEKEETIIYPKKQKNFFGYKIFLFILIPLVLLLPFLTLKKSWKF